MANDFLKVEGIEELTKKLKTLDDNVKRTEVLKIQRRLAKPLLDAYREKLPESNKSRSRLTGARTGKRGNKKHREKSKLASHNVFDYTGGNLKRATKIISVPKRYTGGNPSIVIQPTSPKGSLKTKKGKTKDDAYYRFMIVAKGFKGSGRGSRKGANTVVRDARNATLAATQGMTTKEAEQKTAAYIQKQINRLSK